MTFIVAFARRDVALLASDTRTTMRPITGNEFDVSAVLASGFDDTGVKLHALEDGWLASGPSVIWRDGMIAAIGDSGNVLVDVRSWAPDAMPELEAESPAEARAVRERQMTLVVGAGPAGCYRLAFDWQGQERFADAQPQEAIALCPTGSDPTTLQRLLNAYQRAIRGAALPDVLRATAVLYRHAYAHCGPEGTMSPLLSVGVIGPDGRRAPLGPARHDSLLTATDDALAEILNSQEINHV